MDGQFECARGKVVAEPHTPAIVVTSSVPSRVSMSASTRAAICATAAAGSPPEAAPASRPRAATAAAPAAAARRPEVIRGGGDVSGQSRTSEVGLNRQERPAGVADERGHVPLAQAGPVPQLDAAVFELKEVGLADHVRGGVPRIVGIAGIQQVGNRRGDVDHRREADPQMTVRVL